MPYYVLHIDTILIVSGLFLLSLECHEIVVLSPRGLLFVLPWGLGDIRYKKIMLYKGWQMKTKMYLHNIVRKYININA